MLFELDDHRFVLSVNCGTHSSFNTNHLLSPEERDQYMVAGWVYLDTLAERIANNPWAYESSGVEMPFTDFSIENNSTAQVPPHMTPRK